MLASILLTQGEGASSLLHSHSVPLSVSPQRITLRDTRTVFLSDHTLHAGNFPSLMDCYSRWVREQTYLLFRDNETGNVIYRRASKRGNPVYVDRVRERMNDATSWIQNTRGQEDHFLFITLTYNPAHFFDRPYRAWATLSKHYAQFTHSLRRKYGDVWILRSFEAHSSGMPHIHMLVFFPGKKFHTFQHNGRTRVREYQEIKKLWGHGLSDVQGAPRRGGLRVLQGYIMKDILKSYAQPFAAGDGKSKLTLMMNWLFRKQSFAVSGNRLVNHLHNRDMPGPIEVYNPVDYTYIGVFVLNFHNNSIPPPFAGEIPAKSEILDRFN